MNQSRRGLLRAGAAIAAVSAAGGMAWPRRASGTGAGAGAGAGAVAGAAASVKRLALLNMHTAETLDLEYCRADRYLPESLSAIQMLLRDYRNGEQHVIDPRLLDTLYDVACSLAVDPVFVVISGYRSPQTNERLRQVTRVRQVTRGVARHSLHLEGRAIDVRLAGVNCADFAGHARAMFPGGVGYYRNSDFVHLDTGTCRNWNG